MSLWSCDLSFSLVMLERWLKEHEGVRLSEIVTELSEQQCGNQFTERETNRKGFGQQQHRGFPSTLNSWRETVESSGFKKIFSYFYRLGFVFSVLYNQQGELQQLWNQTKKKENWVSLKLELLIYERCWSCSLNSCLCLLTFLSSCPHAVDRNLYCMWTYSSLSLCSDPEPLTTHVHWWHVQVFLVQQPHLSALLFSSLLSCQ